MSNRPVTKVEMEWMANRLIYLSTPFTLYALGFEPAATMAANIAARLSKATHGAVFSPIAHAYSLVTASGSDPVKDEVLWRSLNERMMYEADILVIAHMDGWDKSVGIAEEVKAFTEMAKPIFDLPDVTGINMKRRWPQKPARERIDGLPPEAVEAEASEFLATR